MGEARVIRVRTLKQGVAFQRLYELYCHELAPFTGMRPDKTGCYADASLLGDLVGDRNVELFVAHDAEGPAGFLWLQKKGAAWTVDQLYLLPACRRKGLATKLTAEGLARHPGPWEIFVLEENALARAFWEKVFLGKPGWTQAPGLEDGRPGVVWRGVAG